MVFSFGPAQYIFGLEIADRKIFILICISFFALSTFTEFLNLLQASLYKFNLDRKRTSNKKIDDIASLDISSSDEHDNEEYSADSNLLKKIPFKMSFAETNKDYQFLYSSNKHSRAAEARFGKLLFLIEMIVYFLQTIVSYSLMQAIMSENFWIFISIILGYVLGYFLFYKDLSINLILFAKLFEIYKRNLN